MFYLFELKLIEVAPNVSVSTKLNKSSYLKLLKFENIPTAPRTKSHQKPRSQVAETMHTKH
jgi:hypothetical protein